MLTTLGDVLEKENHTIQFLQQPRLNGGLMTAIQTSVFIQGEDKERFQKTVRQRFEESSFFEPQRFRQEDDSWALLEEFGKRFNKYTISNEQFQIYQTVTHFGNIAASQILKRIAWPVTTAFKGIETVWANQLDKEKEVITTQAIEVARRFQLSTKDIQNLRELPLEQRLAAVNSLMSENPLWKAVEEAGFMPKEAKEEFSRVIAHNLNLLEGLNTPTMSDTQLKLELPKAGDAIQNLQNLPNQWQQDLKELSKQIEECFEDVKKIEQHLHHIDKQSEECLKLTRFMVDAQYKHLTTEEKIEGIYQGIYPKHVGDLDMLETLHKWEKAEKIVNNVSQGALAGIQIARKLGVELPRDFEKIPVAAKIGFQVLMGIGTGNPLAVIQEVAGLVDLFKGSGPDLATQRHQQLVDMLSEIHQDNQIIMSMISTLQEQILELYALNLEIAYGMQEIALFMLNSHVEVMTKLDHIHHDVLYQHEILAQALLSHTKLFEQLRDRIQESDYDCDRGVFKTHKLAQRFFYDEGKSYNEVMDATETFFAVGSLNPLLEYPIVYSKQADAKDLPTSHRFFYENIWGKTFNYFIKLKAEKEPLFLSLFEPVTHVDLLDALTSPKPQIGPLANEIHSTCLKFFGKLIAPSILLQSGEFIVDFHRYDPLIKKHTTGKLFTIDELLDSDWSMGPQQRRGKRILEKILRFINLSIAQHHLISGGPLIPILYHDFFENLSSFTTTMCSSQTPENEKRDLEDRVKLMVDLLTDNSILARNALLYALSKKLALGDQGC